MIFIEPMYTLAIPNPKYDESIRSQESEYFLRPHSNQFIAKLAEKWEVFIFSSRKSDHLSSLVQSLDPLKCNIKYVLDRRHCCITPQKKCIKDLGLLQNISIEDCLMIDYKPQNVAFSLDNSIFILHWNGSEDDNELVPGLLNHIEYLSEQPCLMDAVHKSTQYQDLLKQIYKPPTSIVNNN